MLSLALGIVAAIAAATLYSLGIAFQAMDAKLTSSEEHLQVALIRSLIKKSHWLLGTAFAGLGWPLQVVALMLAPLAVIQPTLAVGLLVLMFLAQKMLGEHAGRYEYLAMAAIIVGVVVAGLTAPRLSTNYTAEELPLTIILGSLALASLLPYLLRFLGRRPPETLTMFGAGLAYALSGVTTKLAADDLSQGHLLRAGAWVLATAAAAGVGVLSEMSALQARPAIQVAPVVFVVQTAIPVMLAPFLFGENFSSTPLGGVPLSLSLALLIVGAAALARSPLLLALTEKQPAAPENSPSPSETLLRTWH